MKIHRDLKAIFPEPREHFFIVGEKLGVPAVARPALTLEKLKRIFAVERSLVAEALFHVNPMPVHVNRGDGNRNFLVNKVAHQLDIFVLRVCLVAAPPVSETVPRNKRNAS